MVYFKTDPPINIYGNCARDGGGGGDGGDGGDRSERENGF